MNPHPSCSAGQPGQLRLRAQKPAQRHSFSRCATLAQAANQNERLQAKG